MGVQGLSIEKEEGERSILQYLQAARRRVRYLAPAHSEATTGKERSEMKLRLMVQQRKEGIAESRRGEVEDGKYATKANWRAQVSEQPVLRWVVKE